MLRGAQHFETEKPKGVVIFEGILVGVFSRKQKGLHFLGSGVLRQIQIGTLVADPFEPEETPVHLLYTLDENLGKLRQFNDAAFHKFSPVCLTRDFFAGGAEPSLQPCCRTCLKGRQKGSNRFNKILDPGRCETSKDSSWKVQVHFDLREALSFKG